MCEFDMPVLPRVDYMAHYQALNDSICQNISFVSTAIVCTERNSMTFAIRSTATDVLWS